MSYIPTSGRETISAKGGQYLLADSVRGGQNLRGDKICSDTGLHAYAMVLKSACTVITIDDLL